jgi:hypothetical protein
MLGNQKFNAPHISLDREVTHKKQLFVEAFL